MISLLSSQLTRYCSDVLRSSDFMSHSSLRGIKLYKKHQTFQNYKSCIYYRLFIYSEGLQERWGTGYSGKENALTPATIGIKASLHFLSVSPTLSISSMPPNCWGEGRLIASHHTQENFVHATIYIANII